MALLLLVRHGRSSANTQGVLAGRTGGVHLDKLGTQQATQAGQRMAGLTIAGAVSSPLVRCRETARLILDQVTDPPTLGTDPGLTECDYGSWSGRSLKSLAREPLWKTVQQQPSAAEFPAGESLAAMQRRAVDAVRRHDRVIEERAGTDAIWVAVTHGDPIKAVLADALGMHLDLFQRIVIDPGSISLVQYTRGNPLVLGMNTRAGSLAWLRPRRGGRRATAAVPGGGAGPDTAPGAPV